MSAGPGVGIVGLGFMGRTHLAAWRDAAVAGHANHLVAVCDQDPERRAGRFVDAGNLSARDASEPLFDPEIVAGCRTAAELYARDDVDVVSICTPTDSHVHLALAALEAGKHVLVEKPVAIHAVDVERLAVAADVAAAAGRICLPAMCLRFWPGWSWLKETVDGGALGGVRSAVFRRLASRPSWGQAFYADAGRSGGALFDLHIHDADMVRWLFGAPDAVSSTGTLDHVTTAYHYAAPSVAGGVGVVGPAHVVAEGGWDHAAGFPFRMSFEVIFEGGTALYDFSADAPLRLARDGELQGIELSPGTGYDGQVRHLLGAIARVGVGEPARLGATVAESAALTCMLEAERESLVRKLAVTLT